MVFPALLISGRDIKKVIPDEIIRQEGVLSQYLWLQAVPFDALSGPPFPESYQQSSASSPDLLLLGRILLLFETLLR